jgi:hypothetical protein
MTAPYSYSEARLIHNARRMTALYRRGVLTAHEVVGDLVQGLVLDDCDRVLVDCARQLPCELYPVLEQYLSALKAKDYFGQIVLIGPGLTSEEQARLQPRWRAVADQLTAFLRQPYKGSEISGTTSDLFWAWLHDAPRQPGVHCRQDGCSEEAIALSIYCPAHHYKSIKSLPESV